MNNTGIKELPEWITNLKNLEYLDISGNNLTEYPKIISKLPNLKDCNDYDNDYNNEENN